MPRCSAAMSSASAGPMGGTGRASSVKKSIVRCSSGSMRGSSAGAGEGLGRSDTSVDVPQEAVGVNREVGEALRGCDTLDGPHDVVDEVQKIGRASCRE